MIKEKDSFIEKSLGFCCTFIIIVVVFANFSLVHADSLLFNQFPCRLSKCRTAGDWNSCITYFRAFFVQEFCSLSRKHSKKKERKSCYLLASSNYLIVSIWLKSIFADIFFVATKMAGSFFSMCFSWQATLPKIMFVEVVSIAYFWSLASSLLRLGP